VSSVLLTACTRSGAIACVSLLAASCGSNAAQPCPTEGTCSQGGYDGGSYDGGGDDSGDASSPCSGARLEGKQLVAAPWLFVDGVTTDGYVIYTDLSFALRAVPLAGGTPLLIGAADLNNQVYVNGAVVYFAPSYASPLDASLSVWTATSGTHALSAHAAIGPPYTDVSPDGSQIVYFDAANTAGATLTVAPTAGPTTAQHALATGITPSRGAAARFSGSSVVAVYASGSPTTTTLASFGGAGYTQTVLATGVDPRFELDPTGGTVFVSGLAGLSAYPIAGGAGTVIDPGATGVFTGLLTGSSLVPSGHGASAIYATKGILRRSPVSAPMPLTLVSYGVSGILRLSPDENWVLTYQNAAPDYTYYASDLNLVSATTPGSASLLWAAPTGALFGSAFTADSRFVLYFTNLTGYLDGDFMAAPTGGGAPTKVASHGWAGWATTQSKVVLADNYAAIRTGYSAIDIESVDLANPGARSTLASQVDLDLYLTPMNDQIVYAYTCDSSPRAGVWVMPVP
jgi:hypothetical protein